ncbi:MAG: ABC transporter ATP-binding protein [Geminicoccaceae bacterium]
MPAHGDIAYPYMGRAATPLVSSTEGAQQGRPAEAPLLEVRDLRVSLDIQGRLVTIVDRLSFTLAPGEVLGIVGESGCGKTVTARSIIGLNRIGGPYRLEGQVLFKGRDLLALDEAAMRKVRGAEIAMIFQHPMTSLNPLQRIGAQVAEMLATHTDLSRAAIRQETVELLRRVRIPHPERRVDDYPHQFSGGMRQRAMIAQALACKPSLLIADEPTTALDVTMQAQILDLIGRLQAQSGMAMILISHDLGVIAETAHRVMVMYAGQAVEMGEVEEVFRAPRHPYTAGLLRAIPAANRARVARLPSIGGTPPSLVEGRAQGCPFRPRCEFAHARCGEMPPLRRRDGTDHLDRCWLTEPPQTMALAS